MYLITDVSHKQRGMYMSLPLPRPSTAWRIQRTGSAIGQLEKGSWFTMAGPAFGHIVFNCLVVISHILWGDIGPRVMKKINAQGLMCSAILKCPICSIFIKERKKIRVHLSFFFLHQYHTLFCLSINWHIMLLQLYRQQDVIWFRLQWHCSLC